ncbi:MAG: hypothetical protein D3910_29335 [Candidatus Electrothrix sp. ATG2]|nr:hypothetical protein [Candidatus Electrothrix sp. ATG2]
MAAYSPQTVGTYYSHLTPFEVRQQSILRNSFPGLLSQKTHSYLKTHLVIFPKIFKEAASSPPSFILALYCTNCLGTSIIKGEGDKYAAQKSDRGDVP